MRNIQRVLINTAESQLVPSRDDPQNKGLILQVEWSVHESLRSFLPVFGPDSIY